MNDGPLDSLLIAYRRRSTPIAGGKTEQNVWREIRRRSHGASVGQMDFLAWILDSRVIGLSLTAALVIGFTFSLWPAHVSAREAMGLSVFSHKGSTPLLELAENQ